MLHLRERGRSASTINVYAAALRFLYSVTLERPEEMARIPCMRVPMHVPVVLSGTEVERLLGAFTLQRHRVAAMLAYGAGLRVGEVCRLRVDDIDPKRMVSISSQSPGMRRSPSPSCGRTSSATC